MFTQPVLSAYAKGVQKPIIFWGFMWKLGIYNEKIADFAKWSVNDKKLKNASRGIFNYIHKQGKTLPVPLSAVMAPVRGKSRHKHIERTRPWPVLLLSDWVRTAFQEPFKGFYLLGGKKSDQLDEVKAMLSRFWSRYRVVDSDVAPEHPEITIPFFIHGDEGRGQCKRAVLIVLAAQPVFGWGGENCITSHKQLAFNMNYGSKFKFWFFFPAMITI